MNSFDAVTDLKKKADKQDPFWIYKVNNGAATNTSDYIFKSSTEMAKIGIQMDRDSENPTPLSQEVCYFDAVHTHIQGFKSFALWVLHPATHSIICLANMEMRTENVRDISIFFTLWNEILGKVKGDLHYKFNPTTFMCDAAGANIQALQQVYGEMEPHRVVTCKWHFLHNAENSAKNVSPNQCEEFLRICKDIAEVTTVPEYTKLKKKMDDIAEDNQCIVNWVKWWHVHRGQMFTAFRGASHAGVNLAEMGNAAWKRGKPRRLVDACIDDIATIFQQQVHLEMFYKNQATAYGKGPRPENVAAKEKKAQRACAIEYAGILEDREALLSQAEEVRQPTSFIPGLSSKHHPPSKKLQYGVQGKVKAISSTEKRKQIRTVENPSPPVKH